MYEFARGPLVWIAFLFFFIGSFYRIIWIILSSKKDKVVHPYMSWKFGLRSLIHWIIPFGSRNMRMKPLFTLISFLFHFCLLVSPIFVLSHIILWNESWSISWWSLPESLSNIMAIIVVISIFLFALRRVAQPTVRYVTSFSDYLLLLIVGAAWLMAIPFTRIVHMLFFPFTRSYMGGESGYVRNSKDW